MSSLENHLALWASSEALIADMIAAFTFLGVICIPSIIYESVMVLIGSNKE